MEIPHSREKTEKKDIEKYNKSHIKVRNTVWKYLSVIIREINEI